MRVYFFVMLLCFLVFSGKSQDTIYFLKDTPTVSPSLADRFSVLIKDPSDSFRVQVLDYTKDGVLQEDRSYKPYSPNRVLHGVHRSYKNGRLSDERWYLDGKLSGEHRTFWINGAVRRIDIYKEGQFQSGRCFTDDGKDTSWFAYFVKPSFPGGLGALSRYITQTMNPPREIMDKSVSGRVVVRFFVTATGTVEEITVIESLSPAVDKEAMRIIRKMPQWVPGTKEGIPTGAYVTQPFFFK